MKIVVPIMPKSLEEAQNIDASKFEGADIIVMICCLATVFVTFAVRKRIDEQYGKK